MACNSRVLWPTIQHEALEHWEAIEAGGDGHIRDHHHLGGSVIITPERQITILYLYILHCY